jgi:hypothetical protein
MPEHEKAPEQVMMEAYEGSQTTLEENISNQLVKHNITEAKIAELREKYMPLQIKGIDDKETYLIVKDARKEVKSIRVMAEKLCKKGREEAVAIQKAWVATEKDVAGRIGEIENHLEKQEKEFEAAEKAEKDRRKRVQEEQFIMRNQVLSGMGVLYSDGHYTLGEVSFEMSLIKECDPDIWENDIKPKFEAEHKIVQAELLERERIKEEREAELKRQQEELERKQQELAEKEAALKAAQEEQERKEREEENRKFAEADAARKAKQNARMDQMYALGLKFDFSDNHFKGYGCFVPTLDIQFDDDEKWNDKVEKMTAHIAEKKAEEEQKQLAEIEAQKETERKRTLGFSRFQALKAFDYTEKSTEVLAEITEEAWLRLHEEVQVGYNVKQREKWEKEQEEKRTLELGRSRMEIAERYKAEVVISIEALGKMDEASFEVIRDNWQAAYDQAEEAKRKAEMEQAKDKEKWGEMQRQVNAIEVYEMRSGPYRTKATKFRQKLDELKALFDGQN